MTTYHTSIADRCFSPSALKTYLSCPRKFFNTYILGYKEAEKSIDLSFGGILHEALAEMKRTKQLSLSLSMFEKRWLEEELTGTEEKNLPQGLNTLKRYYECYKPLIDKAEPKFIEIPFKISMPNDTFLIGVMDEIEHSGSSRIVHDSKTTTKPLTEFYFSQFENDIQLTSYLYAAQQLTGECNYAVIDGIRMPTLNDSCLSRRPFPRTDLQMEEFLVTYVRITNEIIQLHKDSLPFIQNQTSCRTFGKCPFLGACIHGMNHPSLLVDFKKEKEKKDE